jgi:hypothetical protein
MKFDVLTGQPVVEVTLAAKTEVDLRITKLDNGPMIRPMLKDTDHPIELHTDGLRYVKGIECPNEGCGSDWNVLDDHPSMRFISPGGEAQYPQNPRYLQCSVCVGPIVRASGLFRILFPKNQAKNLDRYAISKVHLRDYTAVRCEGKTAVAETSFQQVAKLVAPRQPNLETDFAAMLVRAPTLAVAKEALGCETFPHESFKSVPVTHVLWPRARWHDQAMNMTDTTGIAAHAKRVLRQAAQDAELEVQALRAEIAQRRRA